MRWAGHVAHIERTDTCIQAKVERNEEQPTLVGSSSLGRPKRGWESNIECILNK